MESSSALKILDTATTSRRSRVRYSLGSDPAQELNSPLHRVLRNTANAALDLVQFHRDTFVPQCLRVGKGVLMCSRCSYPRHDPQVSHNAASKCRQRHLIG